MMASFNNAKNRDDEHTNSSMITNSNLEIGDEFLKILQDNAFNGMNGGDVTDHVAKVLKITEWIKMPNVEKNELRLHVFSKSLSGDAETWWNNEINGTTITWNELNGKFFHKYYPLSHTYNSKILDDLDNGADYFEFIYWLGLKFDNYWEIDRNTKNGLWEFYVNERTKGTIGDINIYKRPYGNTTRTWDDEEFVTVGPSKINTVKRTPGSMSCIYQNSSTKKITGGSTHQSCGSCIVGLSFVMVSLISNIKCEYGVVNWLHWNEVFPSPSLHEPVIKQLAIKLVDEYGFVIRLSLKSVVPFSYSSTNKAFQVTEDPPCLKPSLNGKYELLASFNIFPCPKSCVQTRIHPVNLEFLDPVVRCLINLLQSAVTELVDLIEPHDHLNLIFIPKCDGSWRVNYGKVVLELKTSCIPSEPHILPVV
ncbi:hypothetical protein Tco_1009856 [Tanacetum coccineum]